jgi:predicted SAM-dependent methyltransferase
MITRLRRIHRRYRHASARLDQGRRRRLAAQSLAQFERPYRLNLGCGEIRFEGWINIDLEAPTGKADLEWDLTFGIPCDDSSCRLLYCEHFLEHLTVEQGLFFLRECRRVLQPGGVLRIAMPSLDEIIRKSCCGDWREQDWLSWPGSRFIQTRAEMLNICFRWWGHQWLYDREELHRRLQEAGWEQITDVCRGESDVPELRNRETRADSLLICEARR